MGSRREVSCGYRSVTLIHACTVKRGAQVTSNVFQRVLKLRVNAGTNREMTATAFTVDVDGREYLITAKHVVKGLEKEDKIDVS